MDRRLKLLILGAAVLAALTMSGTAVELYADLAWFDSLGFADRFWTLELARAAGWCGSFLLSALALYAVLSSLIRVGGPLQVRRRLGDLEIAEALPDDWVQWTARGAALVVGLLVAAPVGGSLGERVLIALNAAPWGESDAILGRDPRFYVFYLPVLRVLWSLVLSWVVWGALAVGTYFLLSGDLRLEGEQVRISPAARTTSLYLGAGLLLLLAGHFYLSVFEVVSGGAVTYTDVHAELPARRVLGVLALLGAAGLVYSERARRWRLTLTALALFVLAWPLGLGVYPDLVQRFRVEPNEFQLERTYLDANIEATRRAFRLDEIRVRNYPARVTDPPSMSAARRWTSGLPLWDERPLRATFNQLQGLRAYHEFPDVDNDRYGPQGKQEQVAIGVREFSPPLLDQSARTWQNLHLRYTHGTGVVVSPVDSAAPGGAPAYHVRDLPPRTAGEAPPGLRVDEPRVYFGERTTQYVIESPDTLPGGRQTTGAELGGLFRRALFAWALDSKNILLRQPGSGGSLLMWRREVVSRVRTVAPFLFVDPNPYPVVHEGRVKWILDAYAYTSRYPVSEPASFRGRRVNYLRNAVKAVVDGATGRVSLYVVSGGPVLRTYRSAFPDLFRPLEEMPSTLREHLRYPRRYLEVQARLLNAYHMTDPEEFYRKQDLWSVGQEMFQDEPAPVEPYYLLMPFPAAREGESTRDEFLLTLPFTPRNRDNLSSFLMARNDGEHYGELWLFEVETTEQVFGPRQIEVQIDQDPRISEQLSLWRQMGSRALRGHLLLVPVEGFLLYVEPLFLMAEDEEGAAPGLKRVIAAAGDQVAMAFTLEGALSALLSRLGADVEAPEQPAVTAPAAADTGAAAAGPGRPGEPAGGETGAALDRLRRLIQRAEQALQAGDLSRFARLWQQVQEAAAEAGTGASSPGGGETPPDTTRRR